MQLFISNLVLKEESDAGDNKQSCVDLWLDHCNMQSAKCILRRAGGANSEGSMNSREVARFLGASDSNDLL